MGFLELVEYHNYFMLVCIQSNDRCYSIAIVKQVAMQVSSLHPCMHYCESAYRGPKCYVINTFFPNDPLWDCQQCDNEGTCCTGTNTPPWFSVDLGHPTSDDIEVRICHNEDTVD